MSEKPLLCSVEEAGRLLSIGRSRIYELMDEGALDSRKLGKRRLITTASIESFANSLAIIQPQHSTAPRKGINHA
jgi:excisionase family DNA binding protein